MTAVSLILKAVAEIGVIVVLLWGFINENKLVRFEKKIFKVIKNLRKKRRAARKDERQSELSQEKYASEYETERKSTQKNRNRKSQKGRVA